MVGKGVWVVFGSRGRIYRAVVASRAFDWYRGCSGHLLTSIANVVIYLVTL